MIKIPEDVLKILQLLEKDGHEAYVVGGCVRDLLWGKEPCDWDICTSANPEQTIHCFQAYQILKKGIQHGTVTVMMHHISYEVTTYRLDGEYLDNRRPKEVQFVSSLKDDLSRRDFTINAMAYHPRKGLKDYFNGVIDLENQCLRCVGEPQKRFQEDGLRIMRALRFASVYGLTIEKSTQVALFQYKELLKNIAAERIQVELCKLLCGQQVEEILRDYGEVLALMIPELKPMMGFLENLPYEDLDLWNHTLQGLTQVPEDLVLRLTMLFHDISKPICHTIDETSIEGLYGHSQESAEIALAILKRLKFDNKTIIQVGELILYHDTEIGPDDQSIKRWLHKIGEHRLRQLVQVKMAGVMVQKKACKEEHILQLKKVVASIDRIIEQQQCFRIKDLKINGGDLIAVGVPQGILVGMILNKLMDRVIEEQIENDKVQLLAAGKALLQENKG